MCDFHSVIVTGDGRILHQPSNSHSGIAAHFDLSSDIAAPWWECEWDGRGDMPVNLVQNRRDYQPAPTQVAYRAAEAHYRKLAEILAVDADDSTVFPFPFDQPEYSDVRDVAKRNFIERQRRAAAEAAEAERREKIAEAEAEAEAVIEKFEAAFIGFNRDQEIAFIRALVDNGALSVDIEDVAADEIEEAKEKAFEDGKEQGEETGYQNGIEAACEDMYSAEYVDEAREEAVKEARDEWEENELEEARNEAYAAGYLDCFNKVDCKLQFVNGMPSRLVFQQ